MGVLRAYLVQELPDLLLPVCLGVLEFVGVLPLDLHELPEKPFDRCFGGLRHCCAPGQNGHPGQAVSSGKRRAWETRGRPPVWEVDPSIVLRFVFVRHEQTPSDSPFAAGIDIVPPATTRRYLGATSNAGGKIHGCVGAVSGE